MNDKPAPPNVKRGREILHDHANLYAHCRLHLDNTLKTLTDAELENVYSAARWFSDTNCWWAEKRMIAGYGMAEIQAELQRREKIREDLRASRESATT